MRGRKAAELGEGSADVIFDTMAGGSGGLVQDRARGGSGGKTGHAGVKYVWQDEGEAMPDDVRTPLAGYREALIGSTM